MHGIQAYEFVENVAPVCVGTLAVPGSIVGTSAPTVTLPEYYQIHLIYYVDPETGALLDVNEHQTMSLRNPATGAQALLLFDADLIATLASVNSIVALDTSGRSKLNLIETVLPPVLGIAGGVALLTGIILGRKPPQTVEDELDATSRQVDTSERPASAEHAAASGHHAEAATELAGVAGIVPGMEDKEPEVTA